MVIRRKEESYFQDVFLSRQSCSTFAFRQVRETSLRRLRGGKKSRICISSLKIESLRKLLSFLIILYIYQNLLQFDEKITESWY